MSGQLTQVGGTLVANYQLIPGSITLFRHNITSLVVGAGAPATAASYSCIEGNFGPESVGAALCGNYTFGANYLDESTATWGPGTSFPASWVATTVRQEPRRTSRISTE